VVLTLSFGFAWLIYGILPVGSLGIIYLLSALFVLVMSGFGLVISNHSATMQQAMFVMFFFIIILLLMSGLFTPVMSMPQWAQIITILNPLKYFVDIMRMVYLKGSGLTDCLCR
jgi:ABC-2 type transport system permease protein